MLEATRFIKAYVIKEAILSSEIEGIHTTLIEVYTTPSGGKKAKKETQLVINYTKALEAALKMVKGKGLPLVSRVILEAHKELMSYGEGDKSSPGSYRKQAVRVGNLVPPPATEVSELIGALEKYMNEPSELPALIRAGLVHVQFETIHPFLDGNGRIGRLLIVLMLIESGLLDLPILYPSYYFKKHHLEYYRRLEGVQTEGDYEGWIIYYLKGIRDSAIDAHKRAKEIEDLESSLKEMIKCCPKFKRTGETAEKVLAMLFKHPITNISEMSKKVEKSYNATSSLLIHFTDLGIISERIEHKRNKIFHFKKYLDLLDKDYN